MSIFLMNHRGAEDAEGRGREYQGVMVADLVSDAGLTHARSKTRFLRKSWDSYPYCPDYQKFSNGASGSWQIAIKMIWLSEVSP